MSSGSSYFGGLVGRGVSSRGILVVVVSSGEIRMERAGNRKLWCCVEEEIVVAESSLVLWWRIDSGLRVEWGCH